MTFRSHLQAIAKHNLSTLRHAPLSELSGSLGDLGTLLPLMIALSVNNSIDLASTLVFSGLANILTGVVFGVPLPVQPMKAIAAVAISQKFSREETAAAGLTVSLAVLVLSLTGLLHWLHRVVPVPVVKGIQVGAGLSLAISAGTSLIQPLAWHSPPFDNRIWAIAAFLLLIPATLLPRTPYALGIFLLGLLLASTQVQAPSHSPALWHPHPSIPSKETWLPSALSAALPQLPLTTLNSILAVTSLSASLFPSFPPAPSTTSLGLSVALSNLIGCWFGAMPVCHGSGGLAAQYRFGARSGASIIVLGSVKLLLGLFAGEAVVPLLTKFPKSLLGVMVLAAGVELAKVGQSVSDSSDLWARAERELGAGEDGGRGREEEKKAFVEREGRERWMVMLVTAAGCLAFKNDAVGFLGGLCWAYGLEVKGWVERRRGRAVRLGDGEEGEEEERALLARR